MFKAQDWYWTVGGDTAQIYSSARNIYVDAATDNDYQAFLERDLQPNSIESEADIWHLMQQFQPLWLWNGEAFAQPAIDAYTQDQLRNYGVVVRDQTLVSGITVNGLPFATDAITIGSLNAAYIYVQANSVETFSWKLPDGSFITLDKADIAALQNAVSGFGQDCYACEDTTIGGIESGVVTTLAQIDEAFAAINRVFTGLSGETNRRHQRK